MTREELFRAVGEVREDQIETAEMVKRQVHPWRRFGALAACLALVVTVTAAAGLRETWQWKAIVKSFNPSVNDAGNEPGGGASAGGLDGTDYWTDAPARPTHPDYSTGVEIGQLSGPGSGETMMGVSSCLAWLSPEEIFAQDTAIFRGTVRELHYFKIEPEGGPLEQYYTRALVEVTDPIRGNLTAGETYSLLWLGATGYMSTSISGPLEDLDVGSDGIFMPIRTDRDTGWRYGGGYFCYADLAELYLGEGMRFVFADTPEGLTFERNAYEEIADAETLDEVAAYIRRQIGEDQGGATVEVPEEPDSGGYVFVEGEERTQPAANPAVPQTEPSETVNAGPTVPGPAGAKELPGGAFIGGE